MPQKPTPRIWHYIVFFGDRTSTIGFELQSFDLAIHSIRHLAKRRDMTGVMIWNEVRKLPSHEETE